ncbi:MAG: aminotransferase class IV [Pirellulaceae bacterium]
MTHLHQTERIISAPHVWYHSGQWLDGPMVLSLEDRGLFQGAVVVERLRTFDKRIFCLTEHLNRFRCSTAALSIDIEGIASSMPEILNELLRRNGTPPDIGIVLLATPGTPGAEAATIIAHLSMLDLDRYDRMRREGERLVITSVRQPSAESIPRSVKHRSRLHYYLANQRAKDVDPSAVAVLVDDDGTITETASANILLVSEGVVHSPRLIKFCLA